MSDPTSIIKDSEVTDRALYLGRRRVLALGAAALATAAAPSLAAAADDTPTTRKAATTYNNFYELGFNKDEPAERANLFPPVKPWTVEVAGECGKPGRYLLEDLLRPSSVEERIYRMRCVEAWSMVIPWRGVSAADLLKRFEPNSRAKFVEFTSINAPERLPGQASGSFPWPYLEGLRIDEAMHPLTFLAIGMYGDDLPVQNGAPIRLVVPWKYGFKGAKSITRIRFVETMPRNTWNVVQPREYGFYANVNPAVDHPRWSQASERRIGEFLRRPTLPFNGYAEQVAGLYSGMDLKKDF